MDLSHTAMRRQQTKLHNQLAIPHFLNRSQRSCLAPVAGAACHYAAHKHPVAPAASAAQPTAQAEPAPEEAALLEPAGKGLAADLAVADDSEQQAVQQKAQQDGEKLEQQQRPAVGAAAPTEEALPGAQLNTAGPGSEAPAASA